MAISVPKAKQAIEVVTIGATREEGGTRSHRISVGGQKAMPFLFSRGEIPHPPVIAYEIWDVKPEGWSCYLEEEDGDVWEDPVKWAKKLDEEAKAQLLFLRLMGSHPDHGKKSTSEIEETIQNLLQACSLPLIVVGCGTGEIDRKIIPAAAGVAGGERLLIGNATVENYREMTRACIEHGHGLITESPIDINIAKQANILVQDAHLSGDRIVMYATTGSLGYGLEYAYSIMEKTRLAGLEGDRFMNKPQIAFVGQETWRAKEASMNREAGIMWECITAIAYLHSGSDIIVLRHPESGRRVQEYINLMMEA